MIVLLHTYLFGQGPVHEAIGPFVDDPTATAWEKTTGRTFEHVVLSTPESILAWFKEHSE